VSEGRAFCGLFIFFSYPKQRDSLVACKKTDGQKRSKKEKTNQNRLCSLRSVEQLINNSNNGQEEEYAEEEFEE